MIFSHLHCKNGTDYALKQTDDGYTLLNAKTGTSISLRINNTDIISVNASDVSFVKDLGMGDNSIWGIDELRFTANETCSLRSGASDKLLEYDHTYETLILANNGIMIYKPFERLSSSNTQMYIYLRGGYLAFDNRYSLDYSQYRMWYYYHSSTFRQSLMPSTTGYGSIGNSSYIWRYGYFESCYSDDFDSISDERLKKNIKRLTEKEEKDYYDSFKKLRVSKYEWKYKRDDKDNYHCCNKECMKESIGLIAQDIKKIDNNRFCHILNYDEEKIIEEDLLPTGVDEKYHNERADLKNQKKIKDVMTIKQNQLMAIMINVIQQNQKKIEKLEKRISVLENK